ncbi:MAG: thiolase family protein, partial [Ktedonobacteraceae bacterium]
MHEAVIVSAVRTPIGRANKGALKDVRADDLAAFAVTAALERVPQLDRSLIEDLILGCAFPEGEQ